MNIRDQKRTCSYHIGPTYRSDEAFTRHWNKCPARIKFGYIPDPKADAKSRAELERIAKRIEALECLDTRCTATTHSNRCPIKVAAIIRSYKKVKEN